MARFIGGLICFGSFLLPYLLFYTSVAEICWPEQHTLGFCARWVWQGTLVIPTLGWLAAAMFLAALVCFQGNGSQAKKRLAVDRRPKDFPAEQQQQNEQDQAG